MKIEIEFHRVDERPLPLSGLLLVAVTTVWPDGIAKFTSVVVGDEMGPQDIHGDDFMYSADITHWAYLPTIPAQAVNDLAV